MTRSFWFSYFPFPQVNFKPLTAICQYCWKPFLFYSALSTYPSVYVGVIEVCLLSVCFGSVIGYVSQAWFFIFQPRSRSKLHVKHTDGNNTLWGTSANVFIFIYSLCSMNFSPIPHSSCSLTHYHYIHELWLNTSPSTILWFLFKSSLIFLSVYCLSSAKRFHFLYTNLCCLLLFSSIISIHLNFWSPSWIWLSADMSQNAQSHTITVYSYLCQNPASATAHAP